MPESLHDLLTAAQHLWKLRLFGVVLATAVLALLVRRFLAFVGRHLERTQTLWDDAALAAAHKPLQALIWVLGLNVAAHLIATATGAEAFRNADRVREVLLIAILGWFLLRFVREAEHTLLHPANTDSRVDATSVRALSRLLRIVILTTAALMLMQKLGYSVSGVLAFGGIGGLAVGFAAKDLLANFFGGFMIHLDRPFSIGDQVRSPDRNIEGTVDYIGWRLTRIRTAEQRPLYVPNATFTSIAVENVTRMSHRRIQQVIGIRYEDWRRLPLLVDRIRAMVAAHPDVDPERQLIVNMEKFGASSLDIVLVCHTRVTEVVAFHAVRQDLMFRIMEIVADEGADFAFPTQTLHIASAPARVAEH